MKTDTAIAPRGYGNPKGNELFGFLAKCAIGLRSLAHLAKAFDGLGYLFGKRCYVLLGLANEFLPVHIDLLSYVHQIPFYVPTSVRLH